MGEARVNFWEKYELKLKESNWKMRSLFGISVKLYSL